MALRLVKGSYKYRDQMIEMLKEWIAYNNAHLEANPSPAVIFKNDYHDFDHYLSHLDYIEPHDGLVPASTFFCLDDERNIMVGAVNIRHKLKEDYAEIVAASGFSSCNISEVNRDRFFANADEMIGRIDQPSIMPFIRALPEEVRGKFRGDVVGAMLERTQQAVRI